MAEEDNTPWYDKVSGFMGLGDNKTVDPNTGLTPQQQNLIGYNQLGSLGALLLAAGQKQMPADRAKYLAQIGNIPGQMQQQMTDAQKLYMQKQMNEQQRKLLSLQAQKAETELGREKRIADDVESNIANIPEALRPFAKADPTKFAQAQAQAALSKLYRNPTAPEQTYAYAMKAGGNEAMASALAANGIKEVDLGNGRKGYVNIFTQQLVGAPPAVAGAYNAPSTAGILGGNPAGSPPAQGQIMSGGLPVQEATPEQAIKGDVAYSTATGPMSVPQRIGGAIYNNMIAPFTGGEPAEVTKASDALNQLQQRTMQKLTAEVPGRPTNALRAQLKDLTIGGGWSDAATSDVASLSRLKQTQGMVNEEITRIKNDVLAKPMQHTDADLKKANDNLSELYKLKRDYDTVIGSFYNPSEAQKAITAPSKTPAQGAAPKASVSPTKNIQFKIISE
ncbi:hypothetical protein [Caudoviricetes sp.]|nr:hypothetical protein [Caudoviricetes sp.]